MRIRHQPGLESLLDALGAESSRLGVRAYLVGGYVRDRILERPCKDLDVVAEDGLGSRLAEAVATSLGVPPPVVFERFGTAQLRWRDFLVEFVSARAESYLPESRKPSVRPGTLEEDIIRRDFTCNTLLAGWDGEVLDITGQGIADIDAHLLRTPLPAAETFAEDPLRAVRAVRFAVTLDFAMAPDIPAAIAANVDRLASVVSVERTSDELRKMLLSPRPGRAIAMLVETGIAPRIMPEVSGMAGVEQSGFHNQDVLGHTLAALDLAAARPGPQLPPDGELVLRLGILLHDAGKPDTAALDGERITFYGHPEAGVTKARALLRRLRFSNAHVDAVTKLVALHMRPIQYAPAGWSDGAVRRLVRDSGDELDALLLLARADMKASDYPEAEGTAKLDDLERRVAELDAEAVRRARPPLRGEQLMARFGRPPGPWLGTVQQALLDAVLDGQIPAGDGATEAAWRWLEAHPEVVPG